MNEQKILVFGGSFDPPHRYHLEILKYALKQIKPDKTIVIPAYRSPFKIKHLANFHHRYKMISLLLKKYGVKAEIDRYEYIRKRTTYTYQIASYLKKKYRNSEFYFLMGSDSYNSFSKWKKFKKILDTFKLLVAKREKYPVKNNKFNAIILKKTFKNISSTQIRTEILTLNYKNLDSIIKKYIIKNKLYHYDILISVKRTLSPKRFNHTLNVIKLALNLSYKYNLDTEKVFFAALLHDIAKDIPISRQIEILKKHKIKNINNIYKKSPQILHQFASYVIAKEKYKIKNRDILNAIKYHSTSYKNPSILSKIIFISDFASYDRKFKDVKKIRELSFKDLELAYQKVLKLKRDYIKKHNLYLYEF